MDDSYVGDGLDDIANIVIGQIAEGLPSAPSVSTVNSASGSVCGNCDASVNGSANFCSACGHPLNEMAIKSYTDAIKEYIDSKGDVTFKSKKETSQVVDLGEGSMLNQVMDNMDVESKKDTEEDAMITKKVNEIFSNTFDVGSIMRSL